MSWRNWKYFENKLFLDFLRLFVQHFESWKSVLIWVSLMWVNDSCWIGSEILEINKWAYSYKFGTKKKNAKFFPYFLNEFFKPIPSIVPHYHIWIKFCWSLSARSIHLQHITCSFTSFTIILAINNKVVAAPQLFFDHNFGTYQCVTYNMYGKVTPHVFRPHLGAFLMKDYKLCQIMLNFIMSIFDVSIWDK